MMTIKTGLRKAELSKVLILVIFSINDLIGTYYTWAKKVFISVIFCMYPCASKFSGYSLLKISHSESIKFAHWQLESFDFTVVSLHFLPLAV